MRFVSIPLANRNNKLDKSQSLKLTTSEMRTTQQQEQRKKHEQIYICVFTYRIFLTRHSRM